MNEKRISVIAPVNEAIEKTRILLFKPFNLEKWFIIGFCAWLANFLREGARGSLNFRFNDHGNSQEWTKIIEFVKENLLLVGIVAAIGVIFILTIFIVLLWLNSRGYFMFIDCLAKNKAQIVEPWKNYKKQANSFFGFRLLLNFISYAVLTALSLPIIFLAIAMKSNRISLAISIPAIVGIVLLIIMVSIFFGIVRGITFDFAAPIMYLKRIGTFAAWKDFLLPLKTHFWKIILYFLFKIVIHISIGAIVLGITFVGCCCLCCVGLILFIPYIGTVILLPLFCFVRLYSLCFLRQFGREYDVF